MPDLADATPVEAAAEISAETEPAAVEMALGDEAHAEFAGEFENADESENTDEPESMDEPENTDEPK